MKTKIYRAAAIFLSLLVLTACSGKSETEDYTESENTLVVSIDSYLYAYMKKGFDTFESEHPEIEVRYELIHDYSDNPDERQKTIDSLRTALMAGRGADVYIMQNEYENVPSGLLENVELSMGNGAFCDMAPVFKQAGIDVSNYNETVMEAGQVQGKQYVVPLSYSVRCVITNDITKAIMGANALDTAEGTINGLLNLSEVDGAFSKTAYGLAWGFTTLDWVCNPYYLTSPAMADYKAQEVSADSQFVRDALEKGKLITENVGGNYSNGEAYRKNDWSMTMEEWTEYAGSDKYVIVDDKLYDLAYESYFCEAAGIVPNIDPIPTEDGGVCAVISRYAAVRANSQHKEEAAQLIEVLLRAESQPDSMWFMENGAMEKYLASTVSPGVRTMGLYFPDEIFQTPLTQETADRFLEIESSITEARFPMPDEVRDMMSDFYDGDAELEKTVESMQQYLEMSLWVTG